MFAALKIKKGKKLSNITNTFMLFKINIIINKHIYARTCFVKFIDGKSCKVHLRLVIIWDDNFFSFASYSNVTLIETNLSPIDHEACMLFYMLSF